MISDFSHQFYLPAEHHAIHKKHEEYKDKHEEYVGKNRDEFLD